MFFPVFWSCCFLLKNSRDAVVVIAPFENLTHQIFYLFTMLVSPVFLCLFGAPRASIFLFPNERRLFLDTTKKAPLFYRT
jgi:hypothetical protein